MRLELYCYDWHPGETPNKLIKDFSYLYIQSTNRDVVQFQNYREFFIFKKKIPHKIF